MENRDKRTSHNKHTGSDEREQRDQDEPVVPFQPRLELQPHVKPASHHDDRQGYHGRTSGRGGVFVGFVIRHRGPLYGEHLKGGGCRSETQARCATEVDRTTHLKRNRPDYTRETTAR